MASSLQNTLTDASRPVGKAIALVAVLYGIQSVPALPASVAWVQTNFFTRVFLIGMLINRAGLYTGEKAFQTSLLVAAALVAGLNYLNKQPVFGSLSFGSFKLPGL